MIKSEFIVSDSPQPIYIPFPSINRVPSDSVTAVIPRLTWPVEQVSEVINGIDDTDSLNDAHTHTQSGDEPRREFSNLNLDH